MDSIIKFLATKKYSELEIVLKETVFTKTEANNLLNYIVCLLTTNMINDIWGFNGIFLILKYKLPIEELDDSGLLLKLIHDYPMTYKLLKYKNNLYVAEKNLRVILTELKNSPGKIQRFIDDSTTINDMDTIVNIHIKQIVGSFYDYHFINALKTSSRNQKQWEQTATCELETRLSNLVDIFGLKVLNFLDIPVINFRTFSEYSFSKKVEYYLICINRFIFAIKTVDKVIKNRARLIEKNSELSTVHEKTKTGFNISNKASRLYSCMSSFSFKI